MGIATQAAPTFSMHGARNLPLGQIPGRFAHASAAFCTGTIEKALGRLPGSTKWAVSLTHEQALVEYDPTVARPKQVLQPLRDIGCTISDPRKLAPN